MDGKEREGEGGCENKVRTATTTTTTKQQQQQPLITQ